MFLLTYLIGYCLEGVDMFISELREQVFHYIDGIISLSDLEDWYVPRLPMLVTSPYALLIHRLIDVRLIEICNELSSVS